MKIQFTLNGDEQIVAVEDPEMKLITYLRNVLRLTSVKNGCGEGHCGACTVIIDGKAKLSCVTKLSALNGKTVTTLEALSSSTSIHAIQYAFITEGAIQCGFCTPGFIMGVKALLDRNSNPDDAEIKKALKANICRCTGYVKILRAVNKAASLIREGKIWIPREEVNPDTTAPFGISVPHIEALPKATGELKYADDLFFDNMLYAKVLRSAYPHAKIKRIDVLQAKKVPGVAAVLTASDIPGENVFGPIVHDQQVLSNKTVRYLGDAVAAVYAESEKAAMEALAMIKVDYDPLPVVAKIEDAVGEGALLLHDNGSNIFSHMESGRGDVEEGFQEADTIFEAEYETQYVEHAYLEPESCVAVKDRDGRITIYVGSQGPEADIKEIAPVLGLPEEMIHIAHMPMGGGFGGKEDISVQIIAALGTFKTGRPVKYTFTRRESIITSGKRNSQILKYKTGVKKDGKLTALEVKITAKGGGYASVEEAVILRSVSFAAGPYTLANALVRADSVYLNNAPACAMRGFGNPPVAFASEVHLNRVAEMLGMDPFEIRLRNILEEGLPTITGDRITTSVGAKACLIAVRDALSRTTLSAPEDGFKRGTGIAASYKNVGFGLGMDDSAGAYGELLADGTLLLQTGSVDMGQGADTVMAQIAAEVIGWPYSRIKVQSADTDRDPAAGMTTASRLTFVSGNAVYKMAEVLKEKLDRQFSADYGAETGGAVYKDGKFYPKAPHTLDGDLPVDVSTYLKKIKDNGVILSAKYKYSAPPTALSLKEPPGGYPEGEGHLHAAYCFAVQAVILDVNETTGKVNVRKVIAASDTGRAVNPAAVEGQIEGGVVMGLGYALSEEFRMEEGQILTKTFASLGLRRIGQTPEIETIIIENPHADGPFGAKGMSELPISPVAPAVVSALNDALGVWLNKIPATPENILSALSSKP